MFHKMFYPRQSCFLCSSHEGKSNVTAVDWLMPVSIKPPMLAVALNNKSYSLDLLSHSKEFSVCVLPESFKEKAAQVASATGKLIDKIDEYSIRLEKADKISAPLAAGAAGSVECRVLQLLSGGDHTIVVGEVVDIHFPDDDEARRPVLFNWGSKTYFGISKDLVRESPKEKEAGRDEKDKPSSAKEERPSPKEAAPAKDDKPLPRDKDAAPSKDDKPAAKD
ncbi:MAG: flavin reductase family protein [Candidatus Micrarchaeota archaeon]|nr:flavin reductase family protein [Candidatus Micrarchaeota archaeon]